MVNTFHKCNRPDFIFVSLKTYFHGIMLNFRCFLYLNAVKTDSKLTLHHMGKLFIIKHTEINFKIWRFTLF